MAPPDGGDGGVDACAPASACTFVPGSPWLGPVAVYVGAGTPPACSGGYATTVFAGNDGLDGGPATCSQCVCGMPQSGGCTATTTLSFFTDSMCTAPCGMPETLMPSSCGSVDTNGCPSDPYVQAAVPAPHGSCTATGGDASAPPVAWTTSGVACGPTAPLSTGGCSGDDVCLLTPPPAFNLGLCLYQAGAGLACPGAYPTAHVLYATTDDSRQCTACTCDYAGACKPVVDVFGDMTCTNDLGATGSACFGLGSSGHYAASKNPVAATETCTVTPDAGTPTGTVTPASPTTFCCNL
jgi:hypothetical protein